MCMATLQTFVVGEPYRNDTTKKYGFFVPKVRKALSKIPDEN